MNERMGGKITDRSGRRMELEAVGGRDTPASASAPLRQPELYLDWVVSVVVVVTGAGMVVCCVVVVVLCAAWSVPQPVSDKTATAIREGRMSFFISIIFWFGLLELRP